MSKELTEKQRSILEFIIDRRTGSGIPPTLAEIAAHFGYRNRSTVQQHLQALEKKGFIRRGSGLSRSIEITVDEKMFIPRPVLGEVAAGSPLTVYPDAIDTLELPSVVKMPRDSFLLKVKGESLKDAYIFSGDVVIVNPNSEPRDGQIIVAILDDGALVKRFYRKSDRIELHSENPEYEPVVIEPHHPGFRIVGVVIGMYRTMERRPV